MPYGKTGSESPVRVRAKIQYRGEAHFKHRILGELRRDSASPMPRTLPSILEGSRGWYGMFCITHDLPQALQEKRP